MSIILLAVLLVSKVLAATDPVVTPAPRLQYDLFRRHILEYRTVNPGMDICYGIDSICSEYLDITVDCDSISIGLNDGKDWYECLCGQLSVKAACEDCDRAYNLGGWYDADNWSSICSSKSMTISPIPESILSVESARNATLEQLQTDDSGSSPTTALTGGGSKYSAPILATGTPATGVTGTGSASKGQASNTSPSKTTSARVSRTPTSDVKTFNGNPTGTIPVAAPTGATATVTGAGTGSAAGWDMERTLIFSTAAVGISIMSVLFIF